MRQPRLVANLQSCAEVVDRLKLKGQPYPAHLSKVTCHTDGELFASLQRFRWTMACGPWGAIRTQHNGRDFQYNGQLVELPWSAEPSGATLIYRW